MYAAKIITWLKQVRIWIYCVGPLTFILQGTRKSYLILLFRQVTNQLKYVIIVSSLNAGFHAQGTNTYNFFFKYISLCLKYSVGKTIFYLVVYKLPLFFIPYIFYSLNKAIKWLKHKIQQRKKWVSFYFLNLNFKLKLKTVRQLKQKK